jgi:hypothetical protein
VKGRASSSRWRFATGFPSAHAWCRSCRRAIVDGARPDGIIELLHGFPGRVGATVEVHAVKRTSDLVTSTKHGGQASTTSASGITVSDDRAISTV